MAHNKRTSANKQKITRPGAAVKGRIISAGLPIGAVARAAGFSACSVSEYLAGKRRNVHGQHRIAAAFRKLSGQYIETRDFWGDLWAEHDMGKEMLNAQCPMPELHGIGVRREY